jgi:hypothetical protein
MKRLLAMGAAVTTLSMSAFAQTSTSTVKRPSEAYPDPPDRYVETTSSSGWLDGKRFTQTLSCPKLKSLPLTSKEILVGNVPASEVKECLVTKFEMTLNGKPMNVPQDIIKRLFDIRPTRGYSNSRFDNGRTIVTLYGGTAENAYHVELEVQGEQFVQVVIHSKTGIETKQLK